MTANPGDRWYNRSTEARLRCRATEQQGSHLRQCTEDRRTEHVHQWRGKPFANQEQPATYVPTLSPSSLKPR